MRRIVFPLLIAAFVLFSFAPTLYELSKIEALHADRHFELVHNFYTDYNFYLSRIRQGLEGRWTAVERYTSEPHAGSLVHGTYVWMGEVGRFVRVPWHRAADVYHVSRIVLAVALLALIAAFTKRNILAFLLAVTAASWPKLVAVVNYQVVDATLANMGTWRFGGYMAWWSLMDSLQRITFIPHILAGQALIVFLMIALHEEKIRTKPANWVFLGILAFVLGIIFPPGIIFLGAALGVSAVLDFVWSRKVGAWFHEVAMPYGVVLAFSAPALLYLNLMTSFYPWKRLVEFDIINPLPFAYGEYIQALGPILPLGLAGVVLALVRRERKMLASAAWVIGWIALLVIFRFIPQQSPLRFSEMLPQVPLAILGVYILSTGRQHVGKIIAILLIALGVLQMHSSYLWQRDFVDHKIRATLPLVPTGSYVMYPLKDFMNAIRFLQDNSAQGGVILSETTAGNYIPVYAGKTVYVGHANTVRAEEKKFQVEAFFAGRMPVPEAEKWLREVGVELVFFGPQEQEDGGLRDLAAYPFLTEVYRNNYVAVYKAP